MVSISFQNDPEIYDVQCVPLENLLWSAGFKEYLDILVLDMAGSDLELLTNVHFDKLPTTKVCALDRASNNNNKA